MGFLDREIESLLWGELEKLPHDGPVYPPARLRLSGQSHTAGIKELAEGLYAGLNPARLDPGDGGLNHPGMAGELPLGEPGGSSGLAKGSGCIHSDIISVIASEAHMPSNCSDLALAAWGRTPGA